MGDTRIFVLRLAFLLAGLVSGFSIAAPPQARFNTFLIHEQPWRISRYSELEGKGLRCIQEDSDGNIWCGIHGGAVRYDGYRWDYYGHDEGLPRSAVHWLAHRRSGSMVAATDLGLFEFDGDQWTQIFPKDQSKCVALTFTTESDDGKLWACGPWGLVQVDGQRATLWTNDQTASLAEQTGCFDHVASWPEPFAPQLRHDNGIDVRLLGDVVASVGESGPADLAGLKPGDRILSVNEGHANLERELEQPPGATLHLKVLHRSTGKTRVHQIKTSDTRGGSRQPGTSSVLIDSMNRTWVSLERGRVLMSPDSGKSWVRSGKKESFTVGVRPYLFEAQDGTIWCVSVGRKGNVARFDGSKWHKEDQKILGGLSSRGMGVEMPDGKILVGGLDFISIRGPNHWHTMDARRAMVPTQGQRMIVSHDGALWIGGYNQALVRIALPEREFATLGKLNHFLSESSGVSWYWDNQAKELIRRDGDAVRKFQLSDGILSAPTGLCVSSSGHVLLGGHDGVAAVATFDGTRWHRVTFPRIAKTLSSKAFTVSRNGKVWAAARSTRDEGQVGGVVSGSGDQWEQHLPPQAPVGASFAIQFPDGTLWFGAKHGVIEFDGDRWSRVNGEFINEVTFNSAAVTARGVAWFATRSKGVIRYESGRFESFTAADGLPTNEVTKVFVDADDQLWVGTADGLYRFDGDRFFRVDLVDTFVRFPIRSDGAGGVWLNGKIRIGRDQSPPRAEILGSEVTVSSGARASIAWTGVDKWNRTASEDLDWSWRINDGPWSPFTNRTDTTIGGLATGKHRFHLRVRDSDFNLQTVEAPATIEVLPPYWQTASFLIPCGLSASLLLSLAVGLFRRGVALRTANRELAEARGLLADQFAEKTAQFKAVCDCSPIGIFVTSPTWEVTYVNPRFTQVAGKPTNALTGQGWLDCVHVDDRSRIASLRQECDGNQASWRSFGRFLHKDGTIRHFELVVGPIERNGKVLGFVGAIEDVTKALDSQQEIQRVNHRLRMTLDQLNATQEQIIKQERLTALGQMAAGVAHDINNSLTPLLTFAELLESEPGLSEKGKSWAKLVRLGVSDTAITVRRLDHFYRDKKHDRAYECVDLAKVVSETVELTRPRWLDDVSRQGRAIRVVVNQSASPDVQGDASQLRAALTNLIFNAIDAIDDNGAIEISIDATNEKALVEIADSGHGMHEEQLKRCTDPFYTSKESGSGLGLSECYGIVRQHGGNLQIESTLGLGTIVRFELPRSQTIGQPAGKAEPVSILSDASNAGKGRRGDITVLCIDDDDTVRASTIALLQARGVSVKSAVDGPSGLELLEKEEFQLVICDQGLPGMDGISVMREIKMRWPRLAVAMVSGWSLPAIEGDLQPDAILQKPFATAEIDALLDGCGA